MIDPLASLTFQAVLCSRNIIEHIIDAADPELVPDRSELEYFLRVDVPEFPGSSDLVELTTLEGREKPPLTQTGVTTYEGAFFEINSILDGFLSLQKPAYQQSVISAIATLTMPYKVAERIEPTGTVTNRAISWVMKAGLSDIDFAGWGNRFFDAYQNSARRFLTWQPDNKLIGPAQEEYLYFMLNMTPMPAVVKLRAELTLSDTTTEVVTPLQIQNLLPYQVLCLPVGPGIVKTAKPNSKVVSYKVWLTNQANERLTETRTYIIDDRYRKNERCILFSNSLSGFDTLRLLGSATEKINVARSTAEREKPLGAGAEFSELYVIENLGERTITVQTGYLERNAQATLRYWDELLLATEWYLVTDRGHVALELLTTDLVDGDDDADLVSRTLAFRLVSSETNYSALPPAPDTLKRATGWRGVSFRHLLDEKGFRTGLGVSVRLRKYYLDDRTDVRPITEKPNLPGDPNYIKPTPIPQVVPGTTPFPSQAISRSGSYKRQGCASGLEGGPGTINIPAGKYGGEKQEDAQAFAEMEFKWLDTQAYANQFGACTVSENYDWAVPAGQWHIRFSHPDQAAIYHNDGNNGPANMGNTESLQGQGGPFVYLPKTNDMNFPVGDLNWNVYSLGAPFANKRMKLYKNGALLYTRDFTHNKDGYEHLSLLVTFNPDANYPVVQGDKLYVKYEDR